MKLITLSCPSCGAQLETTSGLNRYTCNYCGSEHIMMQDGNTVSTPQSENKNIPLIADSLRQLQQEGGDDAFVVFVADKDKNYYVQFLPLGGGTLYAETVSNEFLEPENQLNENQVARLESIGWEKGDYNFSRTFQVNSDEDRMNLARESMRILFEIYGLDPGQSLKVDLNL